MMVVQPAAERLTETKYDVVIVGTGLCESILAAALARAGSKVLHMDANNFYGGTWATLPLPQIDQLVAESMAEDDDVHMHGAPAPALAQQLEAEFGPDFQLTPLPNLPFHKQVFPHGANAVVFGPASIPPDSRRSFLLDLVPRPIMAAGAMVELLISSNVGHYIDFRALDGLYVDFGHPHGLQILPGSRADVFQNRFISMLEKRLLMRFVKKCYDETKETETNEGHVREDLINSDEGRRSFKEEMSDMGLTEKLQQFLVHSIAFSSCKEDSIASAKGVNAVRKYQQSMMKYGTKTPYLYSNYGSGELPQAFCRLCAVNGGLYVLRRGATGFVKGTGTEVNGGEPIRESGSKPIVGVVTTEQELVQCKNVFISESLAIGMDVCDAVEEVQTDKSSVWRLMAIINGSIIRDASSVRIMVTVPRGTSGNETSAVRIRQIDDRVMICPRGFYVLYAETTEPSGSENDILAACRRYVRMAPNSACTVDASVSETEATGTSLSPPPEDTINERKGQSYEAERKPDMMWGVTYMRTRGSRLQTCEGLTLVPTGDDGHDADEAIAEARRCFETVHPAEEFFRVDVEPSEEDLSAEAASTGVIESEQISANGPSKAECEGEVQDSTENR